MAGDEQQSEDENVVRSFSRSHEQELEKRNKEEENVYLLGNLAGNYDSCREEKLRKEFGRAKKPINGRSRRDGWNPPKQGSAHTNVRREKGGYLLDKRKRLIRDPCAAL